MAERPTPEEFDDALMTFAAAAYAYLDDDCRFDHHGYCQTHFLTDPCPVDQLRQTDWPERLASHLARWESADLVAGVREGTG